jgi:hypothetical protein
MQVAQAGVVKIVSEGILVDPTYGMQDEPAGFAVAYKRAALLPERASICEEQRCLQAADETIAQAAAGSLRRTASALQQHSP